MIFDPRASRPIFVAEIDPFGGVARYCFALSAWLNRHDLQHHIVTYRDHGDTASYASGPLRIVELKPPAGVFGRIRALRRHFVENGPAPYRPLVSGYQPALHATLAGVRGFHCMMLDTPSLFSDEAERSLAQKLRLEVTNRIAGHGLRGGGTTFVNSDYLRAECRKNFGVDAVIARMGGYAGAEPPRLRFAGPKLRLLSVCRIEANKRLDWVIRALAALEASDAPLSSAVDWRLDLVGQGETATLAKMAAALGIAARVHFTGFVSAADLSALYDQAHLFVMPARQGYGIPAIEALQRGIPVLLHRESGVSDILLNTTWATVIEGDESNMAAGLRRAISNVLENRHHGEPLPVLPSEDEWAAGVAAACGWLDTGSTSFCEQKEAKKLF